MNTQSSEFKPPAKATVKEHIEAPAFVPTYKAAKWNPVAEFKPVPKAPMSYEAKPFVPAAPFQHQFVAKTASQPFVPQSMPQATSQAFVPPQRVAPQASSEAFVPQSRR